MLFKPIVHRGFQGSFILKEFNKYKDFNKAARNYFQIKWHKQAFSEGINLLVIKEALLVINFQKSHFWVFTFS